MSSLVTIMDASCGPGRLACTGVPAARSAFPLGCALVGLGAFGVVVARRPPKPPR